MRDLFPTYDDSAVGTPRSLNVKDGYEMCHGRLVRWFETGAVGLLFPGTERATEPRTTPRPLERK